MGREPKIHLSRGEGNRPVCNQTHGIVTDDITRVTCKGCFKVYERDNRDPLPIGSFVRYFLGGVARVVESNRMYTQLRTLEDQVKVWRTAWCWENHVEAPRHFIRYTCADLPSTRTTTDRRTTLELTISRNWFIDRANDERMTLEVPTHSIKRIIAALRDGWDAPPA